MKKRLISLMLAGALMAGVGALAAGCGEANDNNSEFKGDLSVAGQQYGDKIDHDGIYRGAAYKYDDIYVVLDQNGKKVLHHGDVEQLLNDTYRGSVGSGNWLYDFDCTEPFATDWQHAFFDEKPSEDFYTEECDDCFHAE